MIRLHIPTAVVWCGLALTSLLSVGTQAAPAAAAVPATAASATEVLRLDRLSWGVNPSLLAQVGEQGYPTWLQQQLRPASPNQPALPPTVQAHIRALDVRLTRPAQELAKLRILLPGKGDPDKREQRKLYREELLKLGRQAAERHLLRAVYSSRQIEERMVWFWFNHFNVNGLNRDAPAWVGDYEERAIRPHALGRFRDLLGAVATHPLMLDYLDNSRNAAGHLNENYARELMELHTLGIDGGYTQADVQNLARILTGLSAKAISSAPPGTAAPAASGVVDLGPAEFNPRRHDFGNKTLLGQPVAPEGWLEIERSLDRLASHPATARHIARKLVLYFVSDTPDAGLVARLAEKFQKTDGQIAAVLQVLFESPEFHASLDQKFKDPAHYAVSAVRLMLDGRPTVTDASGLVRLLSRLGQTLYGRVTPDGYPLTAEAWTGSGQLTQRFEFARQLAAGAPNLYTADTRPSAPPVRLQRRPEYAVLLDVLRPQTRSVLQQAANDLEWNTLLLCSPEFMTR